MLSNVESESVATPVCSVEIIHICLFRHSRSTGPVIQSAARPETVHSTHHHHRPYWLSLIFLIFNYQSPTAPDVRCLYRVLASTVSQHTSTQSQAEITGFSQQLPPAMQSLYSHMSDSPWQAKYPLLPSCHHQFHPVGGQTGQVRTEFSGVSQLLP